MISTLRWSSLTKYVPVGVGFLDQNLKITGNETKNIMKRMHDLKQLINRTSFKNIQTNNTYYFKIFKELEIFSRCDQLASLLFIPIFFDNYFCCSTTLKIDIVPAIALAWNDFLVFFCISSFSRFSMLCCRQYIIYIDPVSYTHLTLPTKA